MLSKNKLILILLLIALPFFLTGCTSEKIEDTKKPTMPTPTSVTNQNPTPSSTPQDLKKYVITTIKDAVTKQVALKCEYTDEDNEKIDTYIKGQQVYMENTQTNEDTNKSVLVKGIITGTKLYAWGEGDNKGLLINLESLKEGENASMGGKPVRSVNDVIAILESKKEFCSATSINDSKFKIPSNVEFKEF